MLPEHEKITRDHLHDASNDLGLPLEQVYQLETSVDDVTAETLGNLIEMLLEQELALDVNYLPITMKHSRPGVLIRVLVTPDKLKNVILTLMTELGTLGIRVEPITRIVALRDVVSETIIHQDRPLDIRIKRSWTRDGILLHWKPENKDVVSAANQLKVPTKTILQAIHQQVKPDTWKPRNDKNE